MHVLQSNHLFSLVVVWFINFLSSASGNNNRTSLTPFATQPNFSIYVAFVLRCAHALVAPETNMRWCNHNNDWHRRSLHIYWMESKSFHCTAPFPWLDVVSPFSTNMCINCIFSWSQPIWHGIFVAHSIISHFHSNCWQFGNFTFLVRRVSCFSSSVCEP